jgi:hypothetical protein
MGTWILAGVSCSVLFIFLPPHFSADIFLPDLRQKQADDGSGRNMMGRVRRGEVELAEG